MANHDFVTPVYFAKTEVAGARLKLKRGEQFPAWVDKTMLKMLAPSMGVKESTPFGELPYVQTLNARTEEMAALIRDKQLNIEGARKLLSEVPANG